ncbi:MAG: FAD-dependent oxidoreductase, partial [Pyrinomonadaceae bacterium]|nr:FAD-dependent oxidoreductase [Pyrinomonadaceae bacterium]
MKRDVVIIGGGAAGIFCAIEAGKRGRRTLLLEHADRVGKKIAISGGGRCNFTNLYTTADNFLSANLNFCKSALSRYTPADFLALVEKHGIRYHEKKLGQLFCDGSSREIINMLLTECERAGVEIQLNCHVRRIEKNATFLLETNRGHLECDSLVIATGGLSIPKIG